MTTGIEILQLFTFFAAYILKIFSITLKGLAEKLKGKIVFLR